MKKGNMYKKSLKAHEVMPTLMKQNAFEKDPYAINIFPHWYVKSTNFCFDFLKNIATI